MIRMNVQTWTQFKTLVVNKDLSIQYSEESNLYEIYASENGFIWHINLIKDEGADIVDFETNYKDNANSSIATLLRPFAKDSVEFKGEGKGGTITKDTTQNVDLKLTEDMYCDGGFLYASDAEFGDYIKSQVIDIDDILGYGENYVLKTWIEKWYVIPNQIMHVKVNQGGAISANLYLRLKYTSIGTINDVQFAINYHLYRKK